MPVDIEYLRRHYSSLSDQALLGIDCTELVEEARSVLDEEVRRRDIREPRLVEEAAPAPADESDWRDSAGEVLSRVDHAGTYPAQLIEDGRQVLEAARIPCCVQEELIPEDRSVTAETKVWRLVVPGHLLQHASSVLDRDLFNQDFEGTWRAHLSMLSDAELRVMTPEVAFCGLFDRVARVKRAYDEEVERRGLG
jgi:hypothetical protein